MSDMRRRFMLVLSILVLGGIVVSACSSSQPATELPVIEEEPTEEPPTEAANNDEHPPQEHEAGGFVVPEDAAAVPNPIAVSQESITTGEQLFANNCALCHGATGEGDGPAASGLAVPPANLHADHVQELEDGALFYIISHSAPDSPMPAWKDVLTEDERWNVINFLRTFVE